MWEGDPVGPGIIRGVEGGGWLCCITPGYPVLGLSMGGQGPRRHFHVSLGAADPLVEPLPVGVPIPRHPEAVGLRRVTPKRVASLTIHAHRLGHICVEAHVVE